VPAPAVEPEVQTKPASPRERASQWLREQLQHGPVSSLDIEESAKADGVAMKTLRRAFKAMGGRPERSGGAWWWMLPGQDGRA
jgi:hypothetical protein